MNKRLKALLERKAAAVGKMKDLRTAAGEQLFTEEQTTQFDALKAEVEQLNAGIEQERAAIEAERALGAVDVRDGARVETLGARAAQAPNHGFETFGEFIAATRLAMTGGVRDERLVVGAVASTYANEGSLADGGFLVPPEYSTTVWQHSLEEGAFLPMCDGMTVTGNSMTYPADETTPWGTDGIRAYWEAEAAQATATKPKGHVNTLRLNKLMALIPVTDELQADGSALAQYVAAKAGESIRWKTNLALFQGTGAGQPEGVFNAGCKITQTKESGQAADTIVFENVAKMYARQLKPGRAVWLADSMTLPQLMVMKIGDTPIWTPPGNGAAQSPGGLLLGRPVILTEVAKQLGDTGDLAFVDWKHLRAITKAGGIESATSMHLYFDQGLNAFRFTFRVDAKPVIKDAVTSANGSTTKSPFVFLEDRA